VRTLAAEKGGDMQAMHYFRLELRHATMPMYVASYLFLFLLFVYETHRVGRWIFDYGTNFSNYKFMGYEYLLMLVFVALQIIVEVAFPLEAWFGPHHDRSTSRSRSSNFKCPGWGGLFHWHPRLGFCLAARPG
jgi:hypothetical protein